MERTKVNEPVRGLPSEHPFAILVPLPRDPALVLEEATPKPVEDRV